MNCYLVVLFLLAVVGDLVFAAKLQGIFEPRDLALAGNRDQAESIVARWREDGSDRRATRALRWDFLFMACYGLTLWWGCVLARGVFAAHGWAWAAAATKWALVLTAIGVAADVLENYALLRMIAGPISDPWPRVTPVTFWLKFSLPALAVVCSVVGAAVGLWDCVTGHGRVVPSAN